MTDRKEYTPCQHVAYRLARPVLYANVEIPMDEAPPNVIVLGGLRFTREDPERTDDAR